MGGVESAVAGRGDGRVVLITGASAGIGAAMARRFAGAGWRVVAVARGQDKLDALAAEIGTDTVATFAADVTDATAADRAVAVAQERFGRVDALINNAGSGKWAPVADTEDSMMDEVIEISLKAPFRFARAAVKAMGENGGSIINIGSTWGLIGGQGGGIYCVVKAGLVGLTRSLATDYGPVGVNTNLIAPGVIRTDMTEAIWEMDFFQRLNHEMTPFHREGTVEDVANTAFFLCSKEGSYINGQSIALDGGWTEAKYLAPEALMGERVKAAAAAA